MFDFGRAQILTLVRFRLVGMSHNVIVEGESTPLLVRRMSTKHHEDPLDIVRNLFICISCALEDS